ncbi:MAG: tripartite tricarboxylate transporter substrate-binding protein [Actinobacteria bacterium]|nr:tripartite tricarboxylate transporter substrate-binding protein [Actinomycetota bacterium]
MRKDSFIRFAIAATAVAVLVGTTLPANAAIKPADKATVGDDCTAASAQTNKVAKGRGVEGSDLVCMVVTTGSYKGQTKWWYKDVQPLTKLEWVASSGVGGGYGTTAIAFADAMKAEGMLTDYTVSYKSGGSGTVGLGYFQDQKARNDVAFINGFAMVAGIASTKSALKLENSASVAGLMREWEAIVVPTNSKYRTINQLLDDMKANPKLAIAGGSKGTVDHVFMGLLVEKNGMKATDMNYIPYAGGGEVTTSVLGKQTVAGVSGTSEFAAYVKAGSLRVLALSSAKPLASIKGKTLTQQGFPFVFGNWRGMSASSSLTDAERLNWLKVVDVTRAGTAWKTTLAAKDWQNLNLYGKDFVSFLAEQKKDITATLVKLGLA